jgi:hypothetical protein
VGRDKRSVNELRVLFCDEAVLLALATTGRFAGVFMGDFLALGSFACLADSARTISGLTGSLRSVLVGFTPSPFVALVFRFVCCSPVSTSMTSSKGAPLLLFGFPRLEGRGSALIPDGGWGVGGGFDGRVCASAGERDLSRKAWSSHEMGSSLFSLSSMGLEEAESSRSMGARIGNMSVSTVSSGVGGQ